MFNRSSPLPSPQTVNVPSQPTASTPQINRKPNTIAELIQQYETSILQVFALSVIALLAIVNTPFLGVWVRSILDPRFHVLSPIVLLHISYRFGWRKLSEVGLLWLLGFTPASLLFR